VTSIERTAYPQFKKLTSARVLHVFFTPTAEEIAWSRERTKTPEAWFAQVLDLKCFQKWARTSCRVTGRRGRPSCTVSRSGSGRA
jgi:hypothetical protein